MRIDSHQHFWRYNAFEYGWIDDSMSCLRRDFLPENLKVELDAAGFDGAIAVQARQTLEETRWLLELAATAPHVLGIVGWVDLRSPDVRSQLSEFAGNPKFLGVRHIVQSEPDDHFLLQPEFLRGVGVRPVPEKLTVQGRGPRSRAVPGNEDARILRQPGEVL